MIAYKLFVTSILVFLIAITARSFLGDDLDKVPMYQAVIVVVLYVSSILVFLLSALYLTWFR